MIDHEQILKRFMRKFIRFAFAGPLWRKVPAIFRQPLKLGLRTIANRTSLAPVPASNFMKRSNMKNPGCKAVSRIPDFQMTAYVSWMSPIPVA